MKSLKLNKVITIVLTLVLCMSSLSFAAKEFDNERSKDHRVKLLPIVEKYSPETLEDWTEVLKERKELRRDLVKLHKSKKALVDSERKELRKKNNEYINELRSQVEKGEINQQEAKEKYQQFKMKGKGKRNSNYKEGREEYIKLRKDLMEAVSKDDGQNAKQLLDQLYVKYKESNEAIKGKLNS